MTQSQALEILKTGANVFLTGEPGAGKTYVINQYIAWLEAAGIPVAITASTGIAATHIGGMTIHSWSGIGARDELTPYDLDKITTSEKTGRRVKKAKVLVIDEISMLDGKVVNMVDRVTRAIRQKAEPFGGLQVIFVGDFFQLPPVTRGADVMSYAFQSNAWNDARPLICYLTEQHRQEDEMFLGLLKSIRKNEIEEDHYSLLSEQIDIGYENVEPTKLYTHNADVDAFNVAKLSGLKGDPRRYYMSGTGSKQNVENLMRNCLSPETLELKEEAMVMFTKNNFEAGYVNGTLGRVIGFEPMGGDPIVKTSSGKEITVKPANWEVVEDGKIRASIEQIPLRLAWAITVHKSQGMSLDAAEIDLSKAFVYGQGYVALSRVRSLLGLKLTGMHPNALQVDPRVIAQDARFLAESEMAEDAFNEMEEDDLEKMHKNFVKSSGGKMPTGEIKPVPVHERVKKESTYEVTKQLYLAGNTPAQIAKERKISGTTVWSHLEKLAEEGELSRQQLEALGDAFSNWDEAYAELHNYIDDLGTEKLKPIFEAAGEKYDYDMIRLARMMYLGEGK